MGWGAAPATPGWGILLAPCAGPARWLRCVRCVCVCVVTTAVALAPVRTFVIMDSQYVEREVHGLLGGGWAANIAACGPSISWGFTRWPGFLGLRPTLLRERRPLGMSRTPTGIYEKRATRGVRGHRQEPGGRALCDCRRGGVDEKAFRAATGHGGACPSELQPRMRSAGPAALPRPVPGTLAWLVGASPGPADRGGAHIGFL